MNLIILGPQGCGKGTQARKLAEKFDLVHIDMGKALRQVATGGSELGKEIDEIIHVRKELVPARITKEVLHIKLNSIPREQGIILDGVPRNLEQLEYINSALQEFGRHLDKVFFVKISEDESVERISKRVVCAKCKKVFILGKNIQSLKEKCPKCQGEIIQRIDDTEKGVRKRLEIFCEETLSAIEEYKKEGVLTEINGEQEVEEVFEEILEKL
jgi:adenylate kinase